MTLQEFLISQCSAKCVFKPTVLNYFVSPEGITDLESREIIALPGEYVVVTEDRYQVYTSKMFDKYHDICHKMEPDYDTSEIPQTC